MSFAFFFVKQQTAYDVRISDLSSDVCSSDLQPGDRQHVAKHRQYGFSVPRCGRCVASWVHGFHSAIAHMTCNGHADRNWSESAHPVPDSPRFALKMPHVRSK